MIKVKIKGMKELRAELKRMKLLVGQATARAVYVAGNEVMTEAKSRSPVDTGVMRASGYVTIPDAANPKVEVGFGGAAEAYVLRQHEHTEYRHEVGEAKFLSNAVDVTDIRGIVNDEIAAALESGDAEMPPGAHRDAPE
jgi:hypothetical protein